MNSRLNSIPFFLMQLCGWVKNVGEDFLDHNTVMGDSVKTSQDFLYSHQELDSERQVRDLILQVRTKIAFHKIN